MKQQGVHVGNIKISGHAGRKNKKSTGNGTQQTSHKSTRFCQDPKRLLHADKSQQETCLRNNRGQGPTNKTYLTPQEVSKLSHEQFSSSVQHAPKPSQANKRQQAKQQERNRGKQRLKNPESPQHPLKSTHTSEPKVGRSERQTCLPINNSQVKPGSFHAILSHQKAPRLEAASISNSTAHGGARPKTTPFLRPKISNLKEELKHQQDQHDITTDSAGEQDLMSEHKLFDTSSLDSESEPKINCENVQHPGERSYQQPGRHNPPWSETNLKEVKPSTSDLDEQEVDSVANHQFISQDNFMLSAANGFLANSSVCKPVKNHLHRAPSSENNYEALQQQNEKSNNQQPTRNSLLWSETGPNEVIESNSNLHEQGVDFVAIQQPTSQDNFKLPATKVFVPNSSVNKPVTKHVHWAPSCDTASSKQDKYQNEEYIAALESVNIREFHNSVLEKAIVFMYDHRNDFNQKLIQLAVKMLKLKLSRYPQSSELMEFIDASNFNEKQIVTAFIDFCKTPRGEAVIEPLVESAVGTEKKSTQGNATASPERLMKGMSKENTSQVLEIQEDVKAAEPSSSVDRFEEKISSLDHQWFAGETTVRDETDERQSPQVRLLMSENKFLKGSMKCIKCSFRMIEITTLPCTHLTLCSECINSCSNCPLCNQVILAVVKTLLC